MKDETRARGAGSDGPGETYRQDTPEVRREEQPAPPLALMPTRAFSDKRLRRVHLAVLGALCSFNNYERRLCFPSQPSIAARAGYHARNVREALRDLWEWEYLDWEENYSPTTGAQRSHHYMIHFEDPGASQSPGGDTSSTPASPSPSPLRDLDPDPCVTLTRTPASPSRTEQVSELVLEQVTEHVTHARVRERHEHDDPEATEEPKPATRNSNGKAKIKPKASDLHVPGDADATKSKSLEAFDAMFSGGTDGS